MCSLTYLGGDDQIITLPSKLLDGLSHDSLRLAPGIDLGAVEEVDTTIIGRLHTRKSSLYSHNAISISFDQR